LVNLRPYEKILEWENGPKKNCESLKLFGNKCEYISIDKKDKMAKLR